MDTNDLNTFDPQLDFPKKRLERKRKLLPWWITAFIWIFLVFFAIMPVAVIMGLLRYNFEISLLGLTTHQPISLTGLFLILLFSFKGVTAFALWTERAWAVGLAKIDAIIGIAICSLVMGYSLFFLHAFSFRLELIVSILYFYKMNQLQYDWENFESPVSTAEVTPQIP
jgi:hypothetical protein